MAEHDLTYYMAEYEALRQERYDWESEARSISDFILPGRGIYNLYSKPRKRKLTSPRVINPIAKEAIKVLTSGLQGGLTSPSRPWFQLKFKDPRIQNHPQLSNWMFECERILYATLSESNFYQVIHSFYTEYVGFGTASMYVGEDDDNSFRFELLTFGEYAIGLDFKGLVDRFYRTVYMTPHQLIQKFGDKVPEDIRDQYKRNGSQDIWYTVIQAVRPEKFQDKPYSCHYFLLGGAGSTTQSSRITGNETLLKTTGYYEFPYPTARWDVIGSDVYGIGPGAEALPDVKRLQEMEKAFLMATHKSINPPLNVPARMRGKVNSLPGGLNYSANPAEAVSPLYAMQFDYRGITEAVQRVEQRIQKIFFNDIFLTAARDPNASPMKATEVNVKEQEKMLRLGPVIERMHYEFLQPLIERCFNICLRTGKFPELNPELSQLAGDYDISLVSVLAQGQKAIGSAPIQTFLGFVGQAAQFTPEALDKVDVDAAIDEFADINGVPSTIIRSDEEVQALRQQRAQAQQAQQQKEEQMAMQQMQGQGQLQSAQSAKAYSEAGMNLNDVMGAEGVI